MGHSTIGITLDLYGHLLPGIGEEYASRLDAARSGACGSPHRRVASTRTRRESAVEKSGTMTLLGALAREQENSGKFMGQAGLNGPGPVTKRRNERVWDLPQQV